VLDIDSYHLPDWPPPKTKKSKKQKKSKDLLKPLDDETRSKSAHITTATIISTKPQDEFQIEKDKIKRTRSARKYDDNGDAILNSIMQFVPRSNLKTSKSNKSNRFNPKTILPFIRRRHSTAIDTSLISKDMDDKKDLFSSLDFVCPQVIRHYLLSDCSQIDTSMCSCRIDQVPLVNDLEFDTFINLIKQKNPKQLIIIGIINSNTEKFNKNDLNEIFLTLHYHMNKMRTTPCRFCLHDEYRCVLYDIGQTTKYSTHMGPLLIVRHNVQPGFVLIYQNGQLIFGDYIFNGYGRNINDLKKQIQYMKTQHIHTALPDQFKFLLDFYPSGSNRSSWSTEITGNTVKSK
ncbi:unnamed protein product, partial [Didymodactylos carnosus]